MANPYSPPKSQLIDHKTAQVIKPGKFWKVYLWSMVVLQVLFIIGEFLDPTMTKKALAIDITIYSTTLLGIFGFVYQKKIFTQMFWLVWFPVLCSYDLFTIFRDLVYDADEIKTPVMILITIAIISPLLFIQYLALYNYVFKSGSLWNTVDETESL